MAIARVGDTIALAAALLLPMGALSGQTAPGAPAASPPPARPPRPATPAPDMMAGKPRVFVLTDIGNEPDDQMSMVRLMVYSNEIDIEGLVATTSTWQRAATHPETIRAIVTDYGVVRPNLLKHAPDWPSVGTLLSAVTVGQPAYGMDAVGPGKTSAGARALVAAVDRADERPLWISVWGGANTLAQALTDVRATRTPAQLAAFVARLRVYSISDQDDAGAWIRRNFPGIYYVVQPSSQDADDYAAATWTGISGDAFYKNGEGADAATVSHEWLQAHIRKGPLGAHYLRHEFIMEGDTPAFLNLIGNGLEAYRSANWGGWGGRYVYRKPYGEAHEIWTQGAESRDEVVGADKQVHVSNQATIWRWREAFQHDFAARMDWTVKPYGEANHRPVVIVNGQGGIAPVMAVAEVGKPLTLDAAASSDPDRQALRFKWFAYPEAGSVPGGPAEVTIAGADTPRAVVMPTSACRAGRTPRAVPCRQGSLHLILAVTDDGAPSLTAYRRVILNVVNPAVN